ncbi:MAG: hypothetical protein PHF13_06110 [Acholeplasmataceae bacterium]|nr:hypothetical protein [Acholeplasmataceae bacterium]
MTTNNWISNNSNQKFSIKFDFIPALSDKHSINIKIYRTSLKGIETVIRRANKLTNGQQNNLKIDILANDEGSFISEFTIYFVNNLIDYPIEILNLLGFSGNLIDDASKLSGILATPLSLLALFKKTKGKQIMKEEYHGPDTLMLTTEDEENLVVHKEVAKYYKDPEIREGIEDTTKCLDDPDFADIQFYDGSEHYEPIIINKDERGYFVSPESDKILREIESFDHIKLEVILADFEESSDKWRFRDVKTKVAFDAKLDDQKYIKKVNFGIASFKAGTILDVDMDVATYEYIQTHSLRYKRVITKVHDMSLEEKDNVSKPDQRVLTLDNFF